MSIMFNRVMCVFKVENLILNYIKLNRIHCTSSWYGFKAVFQMLLTPFYGPPFISVVDVHVASHLNCT